MHFLQRLVLYVIDIQSYFISSVISIRSPLITLLKAYSRTYEFAPHLWTYRATAPVTAPVTRGTLAYTLVRSQRSDYGRVTRLGYNAG